MCHFVVCDTKAVLQAVIISYRVFGGFVYETIENARALASFVRNYNTTVFSLSRHSPFFLPHSFSLLMFHFLYSCILAPICEESVRKSKWYYIDIAPMKQLLKRGSASLISKEEKNRHNCRSEWKGLGSHLSCVESINASSIMLSLFMLLFSVHLSSLQSYNIGTKGECLENIIFR